MEGNISNSRSVSSRSSGRLFYGWWILAVCSLLATFGGSISTGLTFLIVPMDAGLGFSPLSIGQLIAGGVVAGNLAAVLVGWLADRFGPRPLVLAGGLVVALGLILLSQAEGYWHFLLTFAAVFAGAAVGFSMVTLITLVNHWFERRRAVAIAVLMTMFALGSSLSILFPGLALTAMDWRPVLIVWGVFFCGISMPAFLVLRSRPEDKGLYPDGACAPSSAPDFTVGTALRSGAFWAMVLGGIALNDAADSTLTNISPALAVAMSVLAILLTLGMGLSAAKFPARKILSISLAIGALGHLGLLNLDSHLGAVTFLTAIAVVKGGTAVYWIMTGDYFGRKRFGSIMGLLILLWAVGAFPPALILAIIETLGPVRFSGVLYMFLYAAAALSLWFARRPDPPLPVASPENSRE